MVVAACGVLHNKKALRACRGAERTEGSGSGTCGIARGVKPFLRNDPVYQQAADARASGCIGASALAAMRKDACADADVVANGDADEPPFTWPSQPDQKGRRRRQRGNGGDPRVDSRNRREDGAVGYASRCQRSGSWRLKGTQSHRQPPPTQRGTARVRHPASASATSVVDG